MLSENSDISLKGHENTIDYFVFWACRLVRSSKPVDLPKDQQREFGRLGSCILLPIQPNPNYTEYVANKDIIIYNHKGIPQSITVNSMSCFYGRLESYNKIDTPKNRLG